jgi:hypothetical protein
VDRPDRLALLEHLGMAQRSEWTVEDPGHPLRRLVVVGQGEVVVVGDAAGVEQVVGFVAGGRRRPGHQEPEVGGHRHQIRRQEGESIPEAAHRRILRDGTYPAVNCHV